MNGRGEGGHPLTVRSGFPAQGVVVVILREDLRVPVGHLAEVVESENLGMLRRRAGLRLLRRTARVRLLSASEGAVQSSRCVCVLGVRSAAFLRPR